MRLLWLVCLLLVLSPPLPSEGKTLVKCMEGVFSNLRSSIFTKTCGLLNGIKCRQVRYKINACLVKPNKKSKKDVAMIVKSFGDCCDNIRGLRIDVEEIL